MLTTVDIFDKLVHKFTLSQGGKVMAMNLEQVAREVVSILESRGGEMAYGDLVEVMEVSGLAQAVPLLQKMRGNTLKFGVRRVFDENGVPGIEHFVRSAYSA